jgi:hypothetical protein
MGTQRTAVKIERPGVRKGIEMLWYRKREWPQSEAESQAMNDQTI